MFATRTCALALAALVATAPAARSQCLEWSSDFELPGTNGTLTASVVFDDGTGPALYVAGDFYAAGGVLADGIARWNGAAWTALGSGLASIHNVRALVVFDEGSGPALFAAGDFTTIAGISANRIARWNGTSWSAVGSGTSGVLNALAVFDDGTGPALYAGGNFSSAGGVGASSIARWNGSTWSPLGAGIGGTLAVLTSFDDGSGPALYAAGGLGSAGGAPASNIARWNGVSWSAVGTGFDFFVHALEAFDDGSGSALYAGGSFAMSGSVRTSRVARWNGSAWSAVGSGLNEDVRALAVFDDGSGSALYAGKHHLQPGGTGFVSRWNGSTWGQVPGGLKATTSQTSSFVQTFSVFDAGAGPSLYAGGSFGLAGGVSANYVASLGGSSWQVVGHGQGIGTIDDQYTYASCAVVFDDGSGPALYVAGDFDTAGATSARNIARWDGSTWSALASGINGPVLCLAVFDDGTGPALYAGGLFSIAGVVSAANIAMWNGGHWSAVGSGTSNVVHALVVFDNGSGPALYAGGDFGTAGGVAAVGIARWDGSSWSGLASGLEPISGVTALAVYDDGSGPGLYVGGAFFGNGTPGLKNLARWSHSTWSSVGGGTNSTVYALCTLDHGAGPVLYAGGSFSVAGGLPANQIASWNGFAWSALGSGVDIPSIPAVLALTSFDDGTGPALYAGGFFTSAGGMQTNLVARWDGSSWSALGAGLGGLSYGDVYGLAVFAGDSRQAPDLYALGTFSQVSPLPAYGLSAVRIARWQGCGHPGEQLCAGDGSGSACPCANFGATGHGCENSSASGGALLDSAGWTSLAFDSLALIATDELATSLSIVLQGDDEIVPVAFGDGLRCAGGSLVRLFVRNANAGGFSVPGPGDPMISARSAALGDPIQIGEDRVYQVYYRDPDLAFCPTPAGNAWNATNALRIVWQP